MPTPAAALPGALEALEHAGITASDIARGPGLPLPVFEIITVRSPHTEPEPTHYIEHDGVGVNSLLQVGGTHQ